MVPATLPAIRPTELVSADGRAVSAFRDQLRVISNWRNALSMVSVFTQIAAWIVAAVALGPWVWPAVFLLMGRAFAQLASLMHEAAHRLLFSRRGLNDWVGRWLLGYPAFTPTDAYRRAHMAHHREEFGPNEPDIALYRGYPIGAASLRRKLIRDATGQTGAKLMRSMLRGLRSDDPITRRTVRRILAVQTVLIVAGIASGRWWLYPLFWLAPYLTVWRVVNRLRSIAEHGGMQASKDRRLTTHSVRQHLPARFFLVPYRIGWHLAHHVDSGVPFRNLPRLHRELERCGYVDETIEYRSYPAIWKALAR
jgi:fatty acid desaturase